MGSLLAGWDSNILDPQVVKYKRNKSLTKEETEAFWRSKKHKEENSSFEDAAKTSFETSNSGEILGMDSEDTEKLIKKHGWWVSSKWAHLNEPPVLPPDEATYKHLSRFKQPQTG
ncbi:uncharacterized protein LOC132607621 isoform X2 [Lycium barbarum]|uniref:uncharacterized protein LOC132607621 isoform X2 n=1 Tax=Lycium barbarum TaxID=112863 RepID=UPI00293F5E5F|nr:uncharacterized protein LOC132607621 isoform X2 [Lycium barbarum]